MKKFILSLFICLLVSGTALLMIRADINSRLNTGDMQKQIYSYEKISESEGELELFGSVYQIDLQKANAILEKIRLALETNTAALPSFLRNYLQQTGQNAGTLAEHLAASLRALSQS